MKRSIFSILFLISLSTSAQNFNYHPEGNNDVYVVSFDEFSLSYNDEHRQPNWVSYELTSEELDNRMSRKGYFKVDTNTGTNWALLSDYKYSGYDRGHLCRAMYCKASKKAYKESFLLSNMSPQIGVRFNRAGGSWFNLEELEILMAKKYEKIYAVSGPVFKDNLGTIGANKITIPGYYYKAFLTPDHKASVGVILEHKPGSIKNFTMVSIDSLEEFTGIDFFPAIEDEIENTIETTVELAYWQYTNSTYTVSTDATPTAPATITSPTTSVQCAATAKTTGVRCKRKTTNENGLCWQHQEQNSKVTEDKPKKSTTTTSGRCKATTKAGSRCKRAAGSNGYCWQH